MLNPVMSATPLTMPMIGTGPSAFAATAIYLELRYLISLVLGAPVWGPRVALEVGLGP